MQTATEQTAKPTEAPRLYAGFGGTTCSLYSKPNMDATAKDRVIQLPRTPENVAFVRTQAAATDLRVALEEAERFIAGFEGNPMQEGVDALLAKMRAAIAKASA